jgi:hypothetical protein
MNAYGGGTDPRSLLIQGALHAAMTNKGKAKRVPNDFLAQHMRGGGGPSGAPGQMGGVQTPGDSGLGGIGSAPFQPQGGGGIPIQPGQMGGVAAPQDNGFGGQNGQGGINPIAALLQQLAGQGGARPNPHQDDFRARLLQMMQAHMGGGQ